MGKSIRTKISLMAIMFTVFIVGMSWIICKFMISGVFVMHLKNNLELTYDSCNDAFNHSEFSKDDIALLVSEVEPEDENQPVRVDPNQVFLDVKNPSDAVIFVIDTENNYVFTTIRDKSRMMDSMYDLVEIINISADHGQFTPGNYLIENHYDDRTSAEYYDLIGTLDNGYLIILRCPVSRIQSAMNIVNRLFVYVAIGLIVFGSVFIFIFSSIFSKPLKRLSHAARKMADLDFDVKIPVTTTDEIGELSISMNVMSDKLQKAIGELKSANASLERDIEKREKLDDMRKEFLSNVSHELKTPIALIQGYAEGLKDSIFDDKESQDFYTDVIIDEANRMNAMVKKLLTLNEIEFGNNPITIERFELVSLVQGIIDSSKVLIDEVEATIEFSEEAPKYVWADEYMIEGVITNYLTNAIHYVTSGGKIRIWFEENGNDYRINVYNTGSQISEEDINKLFIKFYKADKARTREYGGNGIGLSIVAATMDAHHKKYGVYNVEDGVVFYFDLDANLLDDKEK